MLMVVGVGGQGSDGRRAMAAKVLDRQQLLRSLGRRSAVR